MKALSPVDTQCTNPGVAVLARFDRVILKGHRPIANAPDVEGDVDCVLAEPAI